MSCWDKIDAVTNASFCLAPANEYKCEFTCQSLNGWQSAYLSFVSLSILLFEKDAQQMAERNGCCNKEIWINCPLTNAQEHLLLQAGARQHQCESAAALVWLGLFGEYSPFLNDLWFAVWWEYVRKSVKQAQQRMHNDCLAHPLMNLQAAIGNGNTPKGRAFFSFVVCFVVGRFWWIWQMVLVCRGFLAIVWFSVEVHILENCGYYWYKNWAHQNLQNTTGGCRPQGVDPSNFKNEKTNMVMSFGGVEAQNIQVDEL